MNIIKITRFTCCGSFKHKGQIHKFFYILPFYNNNGRVHIIDGESFDVHAPIDALGFDHVEEEIRNTFEGLIMYKLTNETYQITFNYNRNDYVMDAVFDNTKLMTLYNDNVKLNRKYQIKQDTFIDLLKALLASEYDNNIFTGIENNNVAVLSDKFGVSLFQ